GTAPGTEAGVVDVVVAERVDGARGLDIGVAAAGPLVGSADELVGLPAGIRRRPHSRARRDAGDGRDVDLAVPVELDRRLAVLAVVEGRRRSGRVGPAEVLIAAPCLRPERVLAQPRGIRARRAERDGGGVAL